MHLRYWLSGMQYMRWAFLVNDWASVGLLADYCTSFVCFQFIEFIERLRNALGLEAPDPGEKVSPELLTEALLRRAEHLSRIESDGIVENALRCPAPGRRALSPPPAPLPILSPIGESAAIHQLQRRVRALKEQLQRRDLHLDLLRRKLTLQADDAAAATARLRRRVECLSSQLASAADYKVISRCGGHKFSSPSYEICWLRHCVILNISLRDSLVRPLKGT